MNDMQEYFVHEFVEEYKAGHMSRRDMMRRILYITGGVASAASLLNLMGCGSNAAPASSAPAPASARPASSSRSSQASSVPASPARSAAASSSRPAAAGGSSAPASSAQGSTAGTSPLSIPASDPSVEAKDLTFRGNGATIIAYQAQPKGASGRLPFILVVHRNQGLEPHIKDVARRWAKQGYGALALDLLSREGGTANISDKAKIPAMLSSANPTRHVGDFKAAADYLAGQPFVDPERLGINGFCFGGGIVWRSVEAIPALKAAVPFYGPPPPLDGVKDIKAAVLGVYSSDPKDFANANRDKLEAALKSAKITYQVKVFPDTHHDFYNDTNERAYNQEQALAAWKDALAWFAKYLKGS